MDRTIRVLEVIQDNRMGGIAARAVQTAEPMRTRGVETIFVLPRDHGDVADVCRRKGFSAHQVTLKRPHPRRIRQTLVWACTFPFSVLAIVATIRRARADVVHINGAICLQGAVAAILARRPLVWHLADTVSYARWFVRLLRPLMRRWAYVIPISKNVQDYFLGESTEGWQFRIIHEPIDLDEIEQRRLPPERSTVRDTLGLPADTRLVCTVGNLSPRKGALQFIHAMCRVRSQSDTVYAVIIGEALTTQSSYVAEVEKTLDDTKLRDRVFLLGKRNDVYEILQKCDLFVLPSFSEGTPISILEAMAYKVPVVASNVGGIPDQIQDGRSGLLVPPGDEAALADAISTLLEDRDLASQYAQIAFETVVSSFGLDQYVREFGGVLEELSKSRQDAGDATVKSDTD